MTEHTPTPWTANPDGWQPWQGAIQIVGADGYVVAYTATGGPEKENAEHLVRSASSYDALVKALEDIGHGSFPGISNLVISGDWKMVAQRFQEIAREALAKAAA